MLVVWLSQYWQDVCVWEQQKTRKYPRCQARESVENWDDLRTRGPGNGKIGRWRQGSKGHSLDYLVPQVQYKSPRENDFRDCLRVVEGTTPGYRVHMAGMAPLPAVSKPHPMFALTRPMSGTQLRGAGQTLEASFMNANSSDHDPMQCDAGRTRQARPTLPHGRIAQP